MNIPKDKRSIGKQFEKGKSGNPDGRPKADLEIRKYAGNFTREAVDKLVELMRGRYPKVALAAANALLDRAHGKPTQMLASDEDAGGLIVTVNMLPREPIKVTGGQERPTEGSEEPKDKAKDDV